MFKKILKILVFLILAMAGAMLFQIVLVPFLVANPFFSKFEIIKSLKREVVVNPVEQFIIRENDGLKKAIDKVKETVIKVSPNKEIEGCGFILTSDGLVITSLSLINSQKTDFQILDQDEKNDLALMKIEGRNLKTTSFADFEKIEAGEKVFLIGMGDVVNEGIIKSLSEKPEDLIETNIFEEQSFNGCPLFNLEAQFVGLAKIIPTKQTDEIGQLFILPAPLIRSFSGL